MIPVAGSCVLLAELVSSFPFFTPMRSQDTMSNNRAQLALWVPP